MKNNDLNPNDDLYEVVGAPEAFRPLAEMIYKAEFVDVQIETGKIHSGKNFVTEFQIIALPKDFSGDTNYSEFIGRKLKSLHKINSDTNGKSKAAENGLFRQMVNALLGRKLNNSENINLKNLRGGKCYIKVEFSKDEKKKEHVNKIVRYFAVCDMEPQEEFVNIDSDEDIDIIE